MSMKIVADLDKCEGLGMCEAMANDYFEVDEDEDKVNVLDDSPRGVRPRPRLRRRPGLPRAGPDARG